MAKDTQGVQAEIYRYICGIPIPEQDYSNDAHQEELRELNGKLHRANERIIALQERLLSISNSVANSKISGPMDETRDGHARDVSTTTS